MSPKQFSARDAFNECDKKPLTASFQDPQGVSFSRILPYCVCGCDSHEKFYLQLTLNEYDFSQYGPSHAHKSTILFVARESRRTRFLETLGRSLPVLVCTVAVNRAEYCLQEINEDKIEWLTKLTNRTKGIAHEILYSAQYAEKYDWSESSDNRSVYRQPIVQPTVEEENKLLCPDNQIERYLASLEQTYGLEFRSAGAFLDRQGTDALLGYYRRWLEEQVVERDVCHQRTLQYLAYRDPLIQRISDELKQLPSDHRTVDGFNAGRRKSTMHYERFLAAVANDHQHVDHDVIHTIAERILRRGAIA